MSTENRQCGVQSEEIAIPELQPESECANCGCRLGDNDGSTYCRECGLWAYLDGWQP